MNFSKVAIMGLICSIQCYAMVWTPVGLRNETEKPILVSTGSIKGGLDPKHWQFDRDQMDVADARKYAKVISPTQLIVNPGGTVPIMYLDRITGIKSGKEYELQAALRIPADAKPPFEPTLRIKLVGTPLHSNLWYAADVQGGTQALGKMGTYYPIGDTTKKIITFESEGKQYVITYGDGGWGITMHGPLFIISGGKEQRLGPPPTDITGKSATKGTK